MAHQQANITATTTSSHTAFAVTAAESNMISESIDTSAVKPTSEHESRLQLLNIAQELQDMIYEHVFHEHKVIEQEDIDARYSGPELLFALKSNARRDIFHRAEEIYYKTTEFFVKEEMLVPWLSKYAQHSKHIIHLHVEPSKYPDGPGGRMWVYRSPLVVTQPIVDKDMIELFLTTQWIFDLTCATQLEMEVIPQMYKALEKVGVSVRDEAIKVPFFISTKGDFDDDDGELDIHWTTKPTDSVKELWLVETAKARKKDATEPDDVEESPEDVGDGIVADYEEELGDAPMEGLEVGSQTEAAGENSEQAGSGV